MVGIFSRFSASRAAHRRTQSALDEREVLPPISEVTSAPTAATVASHGIEVAVEFKPVEHPSEPLDNDTPIQCPLPEPSILNELTLRRNAIIVLAFLASSGKSGFEIFVSPKLYREANFLMLILQVLVSEIDVEEAAVCAESPEIFKERTLLIWEVLILLKRLVSNNAYSVTVLRVLTNSRDMASLTIDIANRLSSKSERHGQSDCITRQMRESEIVNLARVFRKRVFT